MKAYASQAVFGGFDGLTSSVGMVVASLELSRHQLLLTVTGLAIASALSMGAGEWLADNDSDYAQACAFGVALEDYLNAVEA